MKFLSKLNGLKRFLAKIAGFDGAYLRFSGKAAIRELEGGAVIHSASEEAAVWELMYLGQAPKAE